MKEWVKDAIFYHIYPLGFCGCEKESINTTKHRILKIKEWIPHLKQLHVNALYLGPIFESDHHGYDTNDYRKIDNRLGSNSEFRELCDALHEAGIKIILDGVFNHVGRNFFAFLDIKEKREASSYCGWISNLNFGWDNNHHDGFSYDCWEGHSNLVKLNLRNEAVISYLLDSVSMWMDDFHIDGLRLDAADCVDPDFFRRLKQFTTSKNPDFWLMGEIIHGDYNRWANESMLDSVTNYECYKGLYSSHNDQNYFEIAHSLQRQFSNGGIYQHLLLYNFVDNHDVNRLASTLRNKDDLKNVYAMMYAMPGIPSIYYGSEFAIEAKKAYGSDDPIRPCLDLEECKLLDQDLFNYLCQLGEAYEHLNALHDGSFRNVTIKNKQLLFKRENNHQYVYVAFNCDDNVAVMDVDCDDVLIDYISKKTYHKSITIEPKSTLFLVKGENIQEVKPESSIEENVKEESIKEEVIIDDSKIINEIPDIPLGLYQHYQGNIYCVLYIGKDSDTQDEVVIYRALYGSGDIWVTPLPKFLEEIEVDGQKVRKFTYLNK